MSKNLVYYITSAIALERFHIFTHSYTASFSIKTHFMKLATFFISKTKQNYAEILTVPESTIKIKTMLPWILFKILLTSAIICKQSFCAKTKLYNVFKTKTILESAYNLVQMP